MHAECTSSKLTAAMNCCAKSVDRGSDRFNMHMMVTTSVSPEAVTVTVACKRRVAAGLSQAAELYMYSVPDTVVHTAAAA